MAMRKCNSCNGWYNQQDNEKYCWSCQVQGNDKQEVIKDEQLKKLVGFYADMEDGERDFDEVVELVMNTLGELYMQWGRDKVEEKKKEDARCTGFVSWYNFNKGFGFVEAMIDGEEKRIFIHFSQIKNGFNCKLEEGDFIGFDIAEGTRGLEAHNIELIKI